MKAETNMPERQRGGQQPWLGLWSWDTGSVICYLSFIMFPVVLLWRPLFAGEAFFWGTPLLQFVPWQQLAADMWRSGHLPLWNPLVGCGAPLAANYQTAAFYPLNALHLVTRAEVALSWTVALHVALTGWGMYRWGRAAGLDRFPALVGALALEGSSFLIARAALFPSIALTLPWIPIWLWRAEVLVQRGQRRSETSGAELGAALGLGLAFGLGLLAGHAQTAFYGGLLVAAYAALRTIQSVRDDSQRARSPGQGRASKEQERGHARHALRSVFRLAGLLFASLVVGVGLAAIQLLPTAELLMHSQRSAGVSDDLAMMYSFWPWRFITLAAPDFFGNPSSGDYWGYATYWEDAAYVGLLPLLLAISAAIRAFSGKQRSEEIPATAPVMGRALTRFWVASTIFSLILSLGKNSPVSLFLFHHIPGFNLFKAPARWLGVTTVTIAALAGVGAQHWPRGHRARRQGALGVTVGGAVLIGGLAAPRLAATQSNWADIPATFGPATVRFGISLILAGILSLLRGRRRRPSGERIIWWQAAVIIFIALDLLTLGWSLVPTVDRSLYHGSTETARVLGDEQDPVRVYWPSDPDHQEREYDAQYRVKFEYLTFEDFGPRDATYWRGMREDQLPNAGMLDGIASANNFDPLPVGAYEDLLDVAVETPHVLRAMGVTHIVSERAWPGGERIHTSSSAAFYRLSDMPGRAWIVPQGRGVGSGGVLEALSDPTFDPDVQVLLEEEPILQSSAKLSRTDSQVLSLQDAPNEVTIRASLEAPGYLVLADTWYPGWHATVDGEPHRVLRANHAFRAVRLSQGTHVLEMRYRPRSVAVGYWTSLVTLAAACFVFVVGKRLRRS